MVLCQHYYYWGNIMTERFRYYKSSQIIVDNMTGWTYYGNKQVCDLLNQVNRRADRNAEKFDELMRILYKYNIHSIEKLDKVLFNSRTW